MHQPGKQLSLRLLPVLLAGGTAALAVEPNLTLTPARKRQLEGLACFAPPAVQAAATCASAENLRLRLAEVQDGLTNALIARLALPGATNLGVLCVTVTAPAPIDPQQPAAISVAGRTWPLCTCWPNGAMPSLCPAAGIEGPLLDAGSGEWPEIDGLDLAGSVALMRFGGGRNWERLYSLGCAAVVVVEDDRVNRDNAEGLFANTPLPCPRFYADRATGAALAAATGATCRLTGGDTYVNRTASSFFLYLAPNVAPTGAAPPALTVLTRIDHVNAVSGSACGGKAAGNVAATLSTLDYLATTPGLVRRRGVLFGFLDGDTLGGAASRVFADQVLSLQGAWTGGARVRNASALSDEERLARYERAAAWMQSPAGELDAATARWFADTWLDPKLDQRRTAQAERRVVAILRAEAPAAADAERAAAAADIATCETRIKFLVELRHATLGNDRLAGAARIRALLDALDRPDHRATAAALDLLPATICAQLVAECAEERAARAMDAANAAVVSRVLARLHPGLAPREAVRQPGFGWLVDLSDGTGSLTFETAADGRGVNLPAKGEADSLAKRVRDTPWFAANQAGWPESWSFVAGSTRAEFPALALPRPPFYADFWAAAGVALVPLVTANDAQPRLDTPHDTIDRLDLTNLAVQTRTLLVLTAAAVDHAADFDFRGALRAPVFGRVDGRALRFNMRSGIDAQEPVPGAWVHYPAWKIGAGSPNAAACVGTRRGILAIVQRNGRYPPLVENLGYDGQNELRAYRFDRTTARFDMVLDLAQVGTQPQTPVFVLLPGGDTIKDLVLTEVCPFVLFPGVDPMNYQPCGGANLIDAVWQGAPAHFGRDEPAVSGAGGTSGESDIDGLVLYAEKGRRVSVSVPGMLQLSGPLPPGAGNRGAGYQVGAVDGADTMTLPITPLQIARDWLVLTRRRLDIYRSFGIRDRALDEAADLANQKAAAAGDAAAAARWQVCVGAAREAWGILEKNYPRVLALGREAVFSAVILMALLVPACVFLERLLIGARSVATRLAGAVGLFAAATVFLKYFHPAFKIAASPFIVLIAFTMILMSVIVLGICYQRFEALVRRARMQGGEVQSEEIGLARAFATAFALGVSNLRKRPARTTLTVFTIAVLTFSIVAFVSVRGRDDLFRRILPLDRDVEGRQLATTEVEPPAYCGVLFRGFVWSGLSEAFVSALQTEFGGRHEMVARACYVEREGGNGADAEGVNQIEVRRGARTSCVNAVMSLDPAETRFTGLNRAVGGGAWFRAGNATNAVERFAVILPDNAAAELGITPEQVLDLQGRRRPDPELPEVTLLGRTWRVAGILDVAHADRIRDVNGKSLAMVDYLRSAITPSMGSGFVENESDTCHLSWRRLAIVPLAARQDVRAKYRSVAIRFADGETLGSFAPTVASRLNTALFGYDGRDVCLLTARQAHAIGGLAKILVPVLLCLLIVTNTMMGTVDERKGEVQMLGAIGLSPRQIAFLLLSEATVYAVLGIVAGLCGGILFARVATHFPAHFGSLSFNFTSLSSTLLALGTGAVVLAATLIPARRAAALAAPSGMTKWALPPPATDGTLAFDLPFTLTRGNAIGMAAFFRRFLQNHADASSADFNCRDVCLSIADAAGSPLEVTARMWLAPYDLDVAQEMTLRIRPTQTKGVFGVTMCMQRTSGSEEAWLRTGYGFLDGVRQQFLLWRNLAPEARQRYVQEGAELLQTRNAEHGTRKTASSSSSSSSVVLESRSSSTKPKDEDDNTRTAKP